MRLIFFILLLLSAFVLTACDESEMAKSPEEVLLYELKHCESKYGPDRTANQLSLNDAYCHELLNRVDNLVREHCMNSTDVAESIPNSVAPSVNHSQIKKDVDEIIGDI